MDRQTRGDRVHRFDDEGPDGLSERTGNGSVGRLSAEQLEELASIVETGPDRDGMVRWRRVDLKRVIEQRFGVVYGSCVDGSLLARFVLRFVQGGRVQS